MKQHELAIELATNYKGLSLNEASTRHEIIDRVIHGVLDWPRQLIKPEEHNYEGYADYVFYRPDRKRILVLEAKKEGACFELPDGLFGEEFSKFISIKTLITSKTLKSAMAQVKAYALETGASYAGVTNGHVWIFFKVFEQGVDWGSLKALVIRGLPYFSERFTEAYNLLSYSAVIESGSLTKNLSATSERRGAYLPREGITTYGVSIGANSYSAQLRPIAERFFGVIDKDDADFMDKCYVSDKEYETAFSAARDVVKDSLTPYLDQFRIQDTEKTESGGAFGNRISKSIRDGARKDVIVLFGGKGVGKSTFLKRLLFHKPPQIIKKNAVPVIVDLLDTPPQENAIIYSEIWSQVVKGLDVDNLLEQDVDGLVQIFDDRFELAKRQELYGLSESDKDYRLKLNALVGEWLKDKKYCAEALARHHARHHRGAVIVIDNTDQYGSALQEFCFSTAHEIAKGLGCLVIISMREERFFRSTIHGVLDAYQNSGFHISSPPAKYVFLRRVQYVIKLLTNQASCEQLAGIHYSSDRHQRIVKLFRNLEAEFRSDKSHLSDFLSACAHGNIRLALELFRGLLQSRYTNVQEITSLPSFWTFQIHQVLKPIMIPYRFFYEESESRVPNIYQVRSSEKGSHFTSLRILRDVQRRSQGMTEGYVPIGVVMAEFSDRFGMDSDFLINMDVLLRYGLMESSNRLDEYSIDIDGVRLTSYGEHVVAEIYKSFTYIELVSIDTRVFDKRVADELALFSNQEYVLWEQSDDNQKRVERVHKRLAKADEFIRYLKVEEDRERGLYGLTDDDLFMPDVIAHFETERASVAKSASRQKYVK